MRRGILATRDELTALREKTPRAPFDTIYSTLHKRCGLILESAPVSEANWRATWSQGEWGSAIQAARTTQGRILDLLIAHHVDPNAAFRDRAIEELKNLISWSTWVDPCHDDMPADLCTAEAATAAVIALDWLWEDMTRPDRMRVLQAIRKKAIVPYRKAVDKKLWWYNCYHSWNAVVNSGCGLACLALGDEEPLAEETYHLARKGLNGFFNALGKEGGWDEGTGYWGYAMRYVLLFGESMSRLVDDQSVLHQRGMEVTGKFPVYFTPNGHAASFGDSPSVPLCGTFYLLVKHFGIRQVVWWLDTYSFHRDISTTGWSTGGLALLFRPTDFETPDDPQLKPVKVFNEIGWAAAADDWPKPRMHVAVRTGDLSANHAHHDMNSIQVQVDGEMLLTDQGHPPYSNDYFSQARDGFYHVQSRAHNTVTISDRDHMIDAQGSIIEAQAEDNFRWIACDAGSACGGDVRFIRHIVMIVHSQSQKAEMLIVLDELTVGVAEKVNQFWHTHGKVRLLPKTAGGTITGKKASLNFASAATVKTKISTTSHKLDRGKTDNAICVTAGNFTDAILASVFSVGKIPGKVAIKQSSGLTLTVGNKVKLHFKRCKYHLQLDEVTTE